VLGGAVYRRFDEKRGLVLRSKVPLLRVPLQAKWAAPAGVSRLSPHNISTKGGSAACKRTHGHGCARGGHWGAKNVREVRLTTRAAPGGALRGVIARRFGSGYDHIWYQYARSNQQNAWGWPRAPVLVPAPWYIISHWAYPNLANIEGIQGRR
jgi:hypothetical protein